MALARFSFVSVAQMHIFAVVLFVSMLAFYNSRYFEADFTAHLACGAIFSQQLCEANVCTYLWPDNLSFPLYLCAWHSAIDVMSCFVKHYFIGLYSSLFWCIFCVVECLGSQCHTRCASDSSD